jgi:glutamine amidotransferase
MCRIFGFRSVIKSQVHRSLVAADNALGVQSGDHPDGWGVAYYIDGAPHITRSPTTAVSDQLFHRVSGVVSSETVLAHVRKATRGDLTVLNCHPFQHGRWVFAHNGDIPDFETKRKEVEAHIAPRLRRFILGETDSEVVFFLFLTHLSAHGDLGGRLSIDHVTAALRTTTALIREVCDGDGDDEKSLLTLLVTDGHVMAAVHGGKGLFWSTYKERCGDRNDCPNLAPECEAPTTSGFVNHLVLSSEKLHGENIWIPFEEGEIVAVDRRMRLFRSSLEHHSLQVVN